MRATRKAIQLAGLLTIAMLWSPVSNPARADGKGGVPAQGRGFRPGPGRPGFHDPRFRPGFPHPGFVRPGYGWYGPGFPAYPYSPYPWKFGYGYPVKPFPRDHRRPGIK